MAIYSYSFDDVLQNTDPASMGPQTTEARGSFTVDYTTNTVSNVDITSQTHYVFTGALTSTALPDGSSQYQISFIPQGGLPLGSSASFSVTYTSQTPQVFDNVSSSFTSRVFNGMGFDVTTNSYSATNAPVHEQPGTVPPPICFASDTLILTERGEIPVQNLTTEDIVITTTGRRRPIIWIGKRDIVFRSEQLEADWPVRIMAGAFGPSRPSRDLFLSPQHAVAATCGDEVLIPIKYLINGATIAQVPRDRISYWHIELDEHDLVLAENLAVESFLDTQGRVGFFDNGAEHAAAHPGLPLKTMDRFCRPLVLDGPIIAAVRGELDARVRASGWSISNDADLHVTADGLRIDADVSGSIVEFTVPGATRELHIASRTFVPAELEISTQDGRRLGVPLKTISITDAHGVRRAVAIDDACLAEGFSFIQSDAACTWRWTTGDAVLPAHLWEGSIGDLRLRLDLAQERGEFRTWVPPELPGTTRPGDAAVEVASPPEHEMQPQPVPLWAAWLMMLRTWPMRSSGTGR
jgi:hypothetical protein